MRIVLIDDEGNCHTLVEGVTGDTDDAYLETVGDDGETEWWDPRDIIHDITVLARQPQVKVHKSRARKK